jgi:hypothetical protein
MTGVASRAIVAFFGISKAAAMRMGGGLRQLQAARETPNWPATLPFQGQLGYETPSALRQQIPVRRCTLRAEFG